VVPREHGRRRGHPSHVAPRQPIIAAINGWCMGGGLWYQAALTSVASDRQCSRSRRCA
jgi:enoyl-CoA hydratase/carnithine racemase